MTTCKICNHAEGNRFFKAREMLRGFRTEFDFMECAACGTVQLLHVPQDMGAYYENNSYGSFAVAERSAIKKRLRIMRNRQALLGKGGPLGVILNKLMPATVDYYVIKDYADVSAKILDVGCGAGAYLNDLADAGFSNVSGVDPFLQQGLVYPNGVVIRKSFVDQLTDSYDVIISHHSFEHMPNPLETLLSIKRLLRPSGVCLLTMPVAGDLYLKYGPNCYLIQAPQHSFLFTIQGMSILAEKAGLHIERTIRDADTTANWYKISELWKRDIVFNEGTEDLNKKFTQDELVQFDQIEKELKIQGKGDNVTFVLRPSA